MSRQNIPGKFLSEREIHQLEYLIEQYEKLAHGREMIFCYRDFINAILTRPLTMGDHHMTIQQRTAEELKKELNHCTNQELSQIIVTAHEILFEDRWEEKPNA